MEQPIAGDELRALKRYLATRSDKLPWLFVSERKPPITRQAVNYIVRAAGVQASARYGRTCYAIRADIISPTRAMTSGSFRTIWATAIQNTPPITGASQGAASRGCGSRHQVHDRGAGAVAPWPAFAMWLRDGVGTARAWGCGGYLSMPRRFCAWAGRVSEKVSHGSGSFYLDIRYCCRLHTAKDRQCVDAKGALYFVDCLHASRTLVAQVVSNQIENVRPTLRARARVARCSATGSAPRSTASISSAALRRASARPMAG